MRISRMLAAVVATLVGLIGGLVLAPMPAYAGNWAVTVLDPLPDRLEPAQGYTVGLWVLQHGFHPYEGDLGRVELRLVDGTGASVSYPATALPERAHYAAAVAVPHAGAWRLIAVQGRFADYQVGTLTVPGGLSVLGVPQPIKPAQTDRYWPGAIRPPTVPVDPDRDPFAQVAAATPAGTEATLPAGTAPVPPGATSRRAVGVAATVLIAAIVGFGLVTVHRRLRSGRPGRTTTG